VVDVDRAHSGVYTCEAANEVGPAAVAEIELKVLCEYDEVDFMKASESNEKSLWRLFEGRRSSFPVSHRREGGNKTRKSDIRPSRAPQRSPISSAYRRSGVG